MSILVFILHVMGSCEQGINVRNCACSKVSIPQIVIVVIKSLQLVARALVRHTREGESEGELQKYVSQDFPGSCCVTFYKTLTSLSLHSSQDYKIDEIWGLAYSSSSAYLGESHINKSLHRQITPKV